MDQNCIFCKIANKEIPGKVVYEDDVCMAFLDLSQVTDGHTLVIPKKHYASILEVDDDVLMHMSVVAKNLANKIVKKMGAKLRFTLLIAHKMLILKQSTRKSWTKKITTM